MRASYRKSAPEVSGGKVQKKNNWALTPNYYSHRQREVVIDRKRPGKGYRHLLNKRDIRDFIQILPDWNELSKGLDAIVLAEGEYATDGYHVPGAVHVCAWEIDMWIDYRRDFYEDHKDLFSRLNVEVQPIKNGMLCKYTEAQARAYQLLHVLLHELGHHHDRVTTNSQRQASRGESYAEAYAVAYEAKIWSAYAEKFGLT